MLYRFQWICLSFSFGMVFLTLVRVIFFGVYFPIFQSLSWLEIGQAFLYGFRFDFSALAMVFGPLHCVWIFPFQFLERKFFYSFFSWVEGLVFALFFMLCVADFSFFPEINRHLGMELFVVRQDKLALFYTAFWSYFWEILGGLFFLGVLLWVKRKLLKFFFPEFQGKDPIVFKKTIFSSSPFSVFFFGFGFLLFCIFLVRGGWQIKPISPGDAFISENWRAGQLTLNAPFVAVKNFSAPVAEEYDWVSLNQAKKQGQQMLKTQETQFFLNDQYPIYRRREIKNSSSFLSTPSSQKKLPNVLILLVESFSQYVLENKKEEKWLMPFTQKLAQQGLWFDHFFANGTRSLEGIPSTFACLPTYPHSSFIYSPYQQDKIFQAPKVLQSFGYKSLFLHGSFYGSFNIHPFALSLGYEKVISQSDFPNQKAESDGTWGIMDPFAFQRLASELNKIPKPFFAGMFTLSTHEPFVSRGEKFYPGLNKREEYLNSFHQFDKDLENFVQELQNQDWFSNTVLIITGDHAWGGENFYESSRIPLLFFASDSFWKEHEWILKGKGKQKEQLLSRVGQQSDILPTLFDLLNLPISHPCSGKSLFSALDPSFALINSGFQYWVQGDKIYVFDLSNLKGVFDYQREKDLKTPVLDFPKEAVENYKSWLVLNQHLLISNHFLP